MGRGREGDDAVDSEKVFASGEDIVQSVDGGEVFASGDLVLSWEGGMKPSQSALAPALTCMLFLTKEVLDTVIW